jgi:hypothetical protein
VIKTDGRKLLLDELKLIGISQSDGVPNYQGILPLGHIKHSNEESL